jgi:hypothetical protein
VVLVAGTPRPQWRSLPGIAIAGRTLVLTPLQPGRCRAHRRLRGEAPTRAMGARYWPGRAIPYRRFGRARRARGGCSVRAIWDEIDPPRAKTRARAPCGRLAAALVELAGREVERVVLDDTAALAAKGWRPAPRAILHPSRPHADGGALFDAYGIEAEIEQARIARAPSVGWRSSPSTEALTAVDVNTESFVGLAGRDTPHQRRRRREVVRQLRCAHR